MVPGKSRSEVLTLLAIVVHFFDYDQVLSVCVMRQITNYQFQTEYIP